MTATINEIDITELIDFESEIPCTPPGVAQKCDLDEPAVWRLQMVCCGKVFLICQPHYDLNKAHKERIADAGWNAVCRHCNHNFKPEDVLNCEIETRL